MKRLLIILVFTGTLLGQTAELPRRPTIDDAFLLQTSGSLYNQLIAAQQYIETLERRLLDLATENKTLKEKLKKYEEADPSPASHQ